jgi:hypothetical protein
MSESLESQYVVLRHEREARKIYLLSRSTQKNTRIIGYYGIEHIVKHYKSGFSGSLAGLVLNMLEIAELEFQDPWDGTVFKTPCHSDRLIAFPHPRHAVTQGSLRGNNFGSSSAGSISRICRQSTE